MPGRIHAEKPAPQERVDVDEAARADQEQAVAEGIVNNAAIGDELKDAIDELLDEIDTVLEENPQEFVEAYVQKGGQ